MMNMTLDEVKAVRTTIEKSDDRFTLTKGTLMKNFKFTEKAATQIFNRFDINRLGYIDSYEFLCGIILMSESTFDQKAKMLFNLYDNDKSTTLSMDELQVMMSNALSALMILDGKEPPSVHEIATRTRAHFMASDTDNDQKVNFTEFKNFLKHDKQILQAITNSGVAKPNELGIDFGYGRNGGAPDLDDDLEAECKPIALQRDETKVQKKEAILQTIEKGEFEEEDQGEGDQFMATRQQYKAPDSYAAPKGKAAPPVQNLELEYIYGYRCHDVRNNLRYTSDGRIVYHAAAVGVILDQQTNTQQHFMSHRDDIHCLAINPTGSLCVTGEIGPKPRLCLWSCQTMEQFQCLQIPLTKGIKHVAWSKCGKFVGASDMSDDHSIAIFELKQNTTSLTLIAKGKGCKANIMSLGFTPNGDGVVATCVKSVAFFNWTNGQIKGTRGTGWGSQPADTILCQAYVGNTLFTGNHGGEIISWVGSGISKRVKSHSQKINAMYATAGGQLITGSQDGLVNVWNVVGSTVTLFKSMDLKMPSLPSITPQAISVCEKDGCYLIGTRGGEIIEFDTTNSAKILMKAHSNNELWGLAIHPTQANVVTWDRAAQLSTWDLKTRKQLQSVNLESGGDCLAYSNNGKYLAVGFLNGVFMVLDNAFNQVVERKDRKGKAIQVIKYSPDDKVCVTGAHDQFILTYNVEANYKPMHRIKGHSSTVKFIDFTLDSSAFQSLCQAYETLYFDCVTGKQITRGTSQYKNETWGSWSHPLGWGVQGIWPPCTDGSDINAVDRYSDGTVLASGDDFGNVKLYKFPSPSPKEAPHNNYYGHSSHVTNVQFTKSKMPGQQYLMSTGGEDKCIFQWKYHKTVVVKDTRIQQTQVTNATVKNVLKNNNTAKKGVSFGAEEGKAQFDDMEVAGGDFEEEDLGLGDQALAVKPNVGAIKAMTPKDFKAPNPRVAPKSKMELKWAHGFRSFDTKNNLKYNTEGNVIFSTAGVGVIQDLAQNTQTFFDEHKEDIVSLAYHSGKNLVATGQMAGKEMKEKSAKVNKKAIEGKLVNIFIWDATTCEQIGAPIFKLHRRAVRQLAFSPDGEYLMSIGEDDQHSIGIYNVKTRALVAKSQVGPDQVIDAVWNTTGTEIGIVTVKAVSRMSLAVTGKEGTLNKMICAISKLPAKTICHSVNFVLNNQMVTGTNTGQLITWNGTSHSKIHDAHKGQLNCIYPAGPGLFYTCGADGVILSWSNTYQQQAAIDLKAHKIQNCGVTALDIQGQKMLVGTSGATILEIATEGAAPRVINQGHFKGPIRTYQEVWGCTTHPTKQLFASAGGDGMVRVWSTTKQEYCSSLPLAHDPTCIDWSSDGKWISVGDRGATITILDANTLQVVDSLSTAVSAGKAQQMKGKHNFKTEQWIEACRFSPDNTKVAYGHHGYDTTVEVVRVDENGKIVTKPSLKSKMMPSALISLDWSQDGQSLLVNNTSGELLGYSVNEKNLDQITRLSGHVDTQWQTWSLKFGFPVQGIFGKCIDYTEINTVERSRNGQILATGTDSGEVKLFNWPCIDPTAKFEAYYGHSAHVTKIKFTAEDDFLISTGGGDMTVFVWDTDIKGLNSVAQYDSHPDDLENEVKFDRSKIFKTELKQKLDDKRLEVLKEKLAVGIKYPEFEEIDIGVGDEFLAVKPWKGQMKPPTSFKRPGKSAGNAPDVEIQLEWVHGYRGSKSHNNIEFMADNTVVYYAAGVAVKYDSATHTQTLFTKHRDDVTAIAYHPTNGTDFASGEMGKRPSCFVVDSTTMTEKRELKGNGIANSILAIEYSPSGKFLAILGGDQDHHCAIYETTSWSCIATGKTDRSSIIDFAFKNDTEFVTTGSKHFKHYTIKGKSFRGSLGNFSKLDQRIGCCQFNGNDCLTGNINGDLYKWNGSQASLLMPKLHSRFIDAITVKENHIFTGGRDNQIKVLSKTYELQFSIDTAAFKNSINSAIRAIDLNASQDKLVIGTFGHEVVECPIDLAAKTSGEAKVLIHGHYAPVSFLTNEAWGLCTFNTKHQYATVSDDGSMRIWDTTSRKQVTMLSLETDINGKPIPRLNDGAISLGAQARAIEVNNTEEYLAMGMRDGSLRVFQSSNQAPFWKEISIYVCKHKKIPAEWIEDLKFSPDGQYLLVTSHNNFSYLFQVPDFNKPVSVFGKSSSYITHVDWSLDSGTIRTNDGSYELLYYSIPDGKQLTSGASQFRDEVWQTQSCVLGWATQGIWQSGYDGSDINHADRSNKPLSNGQQVMATADDRGFVNVFKYPTPADQPAKHVVGKGHSSHVTKVRFSADDNYLYSTGGNDTTVMQWKIIPTQSSMFQ